MTAYGEWLPKRTYRRNPAFCEAVTNRLKRHGVKAGAPEKIFVGRWKKCVLNPAYNPAFVLETLREVEASGITEWLEVSK